MKRQPDYDYDDEEENDLWDDNTEPQPLQAPRINLTDKQKQPEYEEEEEY